MEANRSNQSALLLCAMILLTPALGYPHEELLQDTLKSILVAFFTLSAAMVFFWRLRQEKAEIQIHPILLAPLLLMGYALGSMVWSHTYLASVEAIRWFLFSFILFLGLNTFSPLRITHLVWSIHIGAVIASLWTALQFWLDFSFFAQGPNPASTFVNRNFFGEFIVCTFPYSVLLFTRVKDKTTVFALALSLAFNVVALMQTGTRSGLVGLLVFVVFLPVIVGLYRKQVESTGWRVGHCVALVALVLTSIVTLGSIPTTNSKIISETGHGNAIDRAFKRTLSLTQTTEYSEGSFSVRAVMWKATWKMIKANPVSGVGAGAWEVHIPIYQEANGQLETDYYAHNEILQLLAEYGLVGWIFLISVIGYLIRAAYVTTVNTSEKGLKVALTRALTLSSLLSLMLVSNAGFPWRMATTGALFALSLSILAATDIRPSLRTPLAWRTINWKPEFSTWAMVATGICSVLAIFIAQRAIECESKIVRAIKIVMTISQSGAPTDPRWGNLKTEALRLIDEGIAINPHYRKLTPIVADAFANWGDWKNASRLWASVSASRPYVVALLANLARAELENGNLPVAEQYINRAIKLQPESNSLKALQIMLWMRTGRDQQAGQRARELLRATQVPQDVVRTAYYLGMHNRDPALAVEALELRIKKWPEQSADGWLKLGHIYSSPQAYDEVKALQSYKSAMAAAEPKQVNFIRSKIPPRYLSKLHPNAVKD